MTQPSEEAIRKACEEAGIVPTWADLSQQLPDAVIPRLLTALARRIEAEAVPVDRATAAEAREAKLREELAEIADATEDDCETAWIAVQARAALETDHGA